MIKIVNIVWDTEDNGKTVPQEKLGLPSELEINKDDLMEEYDLDEGDDLEDCISDYLSDEYGYCVCSFECE